MDANFLIHSYNIQKQGVLYFSTVRDNHKTLEFAQNHVVAFTTVPVGTIEHVRVINATVQKSDSTIFDFKDAFINKIPDYETTIAQIGEFLDLYEINFKEASVTLSFDQAGMVYL